MPACDARQLRQRLHDFDVADLGVDGRGLRLLLQDKIFCLNISTPGVHVTLLDDARVLPLFVAEVQNVRTSVQIRFANVDVSVEVANLRLHDAQRNVQLLHAVPCAAKPHAYLLHVHLVETVATDFVDAQVSLPLRVRAVTKTVAHQATCAYPRRLMW